MRIRSLKHQKREVGLGLERIQTHTPSGEQKKDLQMESLVKAKYPCLIREECSRRKTVRWKLDKGWRKFKPWRTQNTREVILTLFSRNWECIKGFWVRETRRKQSFRRIKLAMVWKRDWKWGDQLGDFLRRIPWHSNPWLSGGCACHFGCAVCCLDETGIFRLFVPCPMGSHGMA